MTKQKRYGYTGLVHFVNSVRAEIVLQGSSIYCGEIFDFCTKQGMRDPFIPGKRLLIFIEINVKSDKKYNKWRDNQTNDFITQNLIQKQTALEE